MDGAKLQSASVSATHPMAGANCFRQVRRIAGGVGTTAGHRARDSAKTTAGITIAFATASCFLSAMLADAASRSAAAPWATDEAQVSELTRDGPVSQGQGALRPVRSPPGASPYRSTGGRRGLHGRGGTRRNGINFAVATLGTATTTRSPRTQLFRLTDRVEFCFDGDRAGKKAAWRALETTIPQIRDGRQVPFRIPARRSRSRHLCQANTAARVSSSLLDNGMALSELPDRWSSRARWSSTMR